MTQEPLKPEMDTQDKAGEPWTHPSQTKQDHNKDCTPLDIVAQSSHRPNTTLIVNSSYKNNNNNNNKRAQAHVGHVVSVSVAAIGTMLGRALCGLCFFFKFSALGLLLFFCFSPISPPFFPSLSTVITVWRVPGCPFLRAQLAGLRGLLIMGAF